MKTTLSALILLAGFCAAVPAGPLQPKEVPVGARWVLHLDVEQFKNNALGRVLGEKLLDQQLAKPAANLKRDLDFDLDWRRIRSITAFGTELKKKPDENAVLIIKSDLEVAEVLDVAVERFAAAGVEESKSLRRVANTVPELYALGSQAYAALLPGNVLIVGKSRERVEETSRVMRGQAPSLAVARKLADLGSADGFLTAALAGPLGDEIKLPAQAAALRSVTGAQLNFTEEGGQVKGAVTLKANSAETATQIQQILQGLVALGALSQPDHADLQQLIKTAKVGASEALVTFSTRFPAERLAEELVKRAGKR